MTAVDVVLGDMLKRARDRNGMSQRAFAKALGVTQGAVSAWETGAGRPDASRFPRIAELLDIDIGDLARAVANV